MTRGQLEILKYPVTFPGREVGRLKETAGSKDDCAFLAIGQDTIAESEHYTIHLDSFYTSSSNG